MFDESEWAEIARQLLILTSNGTLTWFQNQSSEPPTTFAVDTSANTRYLLMSVDDDARFPFRLALLRRTDVEETFGFVDAFVSQPYEEGVGSASEAMDDLYSLVARQITGAPQLLKSLFDEFSSLRNHNNEPF